MGVVVPAVAPCLSRAGLKKRLPLGRATIEHSFYTDFPSSPALVGGMILLKRTAHVAVYIQVHSVVQVQNQRRKQSFEFAAVRRHHDGEIQIEPDAVVIVQAARVWIIIP